MANDRELRALAATADLKSRSERERDDGLGAFRGMLVGAPLSVGLWFAIFALCRWLA